MATPGLAASVTDFPFFPPADAAAAANNVSSANATISHESADYDEEEEDWLSPRRLLSLLTTVLVPLVFGVIVVVGENNPFVQGDPGSRVLYRRSNPGPRPPGNPLQGRLNKYSGRQ